MIEDIISNKLIEYLPGNFWYLEIFNNTIFRYLTAVVVFFALIVVFSIVMSVISSGLKKLAGKTKTDLDDLALKVFTTLRPPFYWFLAFYLALRMLAISGFVLSLAELLFILVVVFQAVKILSVTIDYLSGSKLIKEDDRGTRLAVQTIGKLAKIGVWSFALLFALSNFGINITSLVAGLGIGGVAVALALQNILGDLFSYFAINFDKPFAPGDFIIVGDKMGVVEKIGIKTTRVRALQGEELIFSNRELSASQIQNFKRMADRRATFGFGVVYGTPVETLRKIPIIVASIVGKMEKVRFDRAHFKAFGNSSLDFEVVYYVLSSDIKDYLNANQEIHLKLMEDFVKEGIDFAFPTQTVYLARS